LLDYLASPEFRLMTIHLAWFAAARSWRPPLPAEISPFPANEPVPPPGLMDFASGTLQARWKKLVAAGKQMEDLDPEALHRVRIRAKQTRYAAEMFQTLFPGKAASRFIRRLSVLQERLGILNDGSVAGQLLEELGGPGGRHAYAAGVIAGFMAARTARVRPRTFGAFDKFRRVPTYWNP
jgi:triphosphatase